MKMHQEAEHATAQHYDSHPFDYLTAKQEENIEKLWKGATAIKLLRMLTVM